MCPECNLKLEYFSGLEYMPDFLYCPDCNDWAYDFDNQRLFRLV